MNRKTNTTHSLTQSDLSFHLVWLIPCAGNCLFLFYGRSVVLNCRPILVVLINVRDVRVFYRSPSWLLSPFVRLLCNYAYSMVGGRSAGTLENLSLSIECKCMRSWRAFFVQHYANIAQHNRNSDNKRIELYWILNSMTICSDNIRK